MRRHISAVVLVCALNGVGVWAGDECATKINDPTWDPWSQEFLEKTAGAEPLLKACERSRYLQSCKGPDGAAGFTGYYCQRGPDRHHTERTYEGLWAAPSSCPHPGKTRVNLRMGPTKVLSMNPTYIIHRRSFSHLFNDESDWRADAHFGLSARSFQSSTPELRP